MLITTGVAFYTSRVILEKLGVNDFGIYNVVGGIVSMFSIISSSLTTSISRYLTFGLGREDFKKVQKIFSTAIIIQIILIFLVAIFIETGGVWFLNNKMVIAPERLYAANWVLQCSLLTFAISMLSIPYNSVIIAHENMNVFAYISIIEALLKLGVAFLLFISIFDNLIFYAILLTISSAIIQSIYVSYCKIKYKETNIKFKIDKTLLKEMLSFSGWNFMGSFADVMKDQGVNIVLNLFFGTVVNAARTIGLQVYHGVRTFSQNFMLAVNPQIIKLYSTGEDSKMLELAFRSSRLSFCLLYTLSLPLFFYTSWVLKIWLKDVPEYSSVFTKLLLIYGLSEVMQMSLQYIFQATGKIKQYQSIISSILILNLPISYILLKIGLKPDTVFIIAIILSQCCLFARLILLKKIIIYSIKKFLSEVYLGSFIIAFTGCLLPFVYKSIFDNETAITIISGLLVTFISGFSCSWFLGLNRDERNFLYKKIISLRNKFRFN